ncbi:MULTISPECIES: hypothetical protein [unclassified Streptomyces]|uniref:hypothetical protein n=1 Tax=unclassified Streptomyces TaxID=2593676 RepID=UPI00371CCFFF
MPVARLLQGGLVGVQGGDDCGAFRAGRFAQGGKAVDTRASVILGVGAGVFDRPDAAQITARLGTALTDAITRVIGDGLRAGTMVELVASPPERTFVGGALAV